MYLCVCVCVYKNVPGTYITFKAPIIKMYNQIIAISLGHPRYRNMDMTPHLCQAICGDSANWGTRKYKYPLFVKYLTIIERKIIVQNVPTVDKVLGVVVLNSQQHNTLASSCSQSQSMR